MNIAPEQNIPSEGEPNPHGFRVRIENPDLLYGAVEGGKSGEIGDVLLEAPVESVKAKLEARGDSFDVIGEVRPAFDASIYRYDKSQRISSNLLNKYRQYGEIVERGGNYIIQGPRGARFVLTREASLDQIKVSTGEVLDLIREGKRLLPSPKSSREEFDKVMADFGVVLADAVEAVYEADDRESNDEELVLHPPKMGTNGRSGKHRLGDTSTTPEELLGKLEIERPDVSFEDIGGQAHAKREIQGLSFALKNPELYHKWGTKPPKGIMLYGPPGTGKTLMAKALASQADARFFHVEVSDIASKWYGESEHIVKSIFDLANTNGKTIIFFDEVDAIAPDREGAHEATQRVLSTILENMDGLSSNENVMVVASTNRLEAIDPALLRAGRFDRWVEVPLPDEEGRKQILGIHMRKAEELAGRSLFADVSLDAIVPKTEQSSGADIAEIIRRVLEEKVRQEGTGQEPALVTTEDVLKEIKSYERVRESKKSIGFRTQQSHVVT